MTSDNCDYFYLINGVTHWMPLPALPENES
ncbi:MAG: DUF551 domain-containing protein [Gammaproteobacteria bacterium]|nr:DUF551 domain-containing protein [Gammaproteobacteria bacterium]